MNPLDYSTSSRIKIWNEASTPLPFKFNIKGKEVNTFCEALSKRANKSGWNLAKADIIMTNGSSTPAIQQNCSPSMVNLLLPNYCCSGRMDH
jgi:hypothetical protein